MDSTPEGNLKQNLSAATRFYVASIATLVVIACVYLLRKVINRDNAIKVVAPFLCLFIFIWAMIVVAFFLFVIAVYPNIFEGIRQRKYKRLLGGNYVPVAQSNSLLI